MYRDDPICKGPDGGDKTKIWRYMSFQQFVSLLDTEALFFCQGDKIPDDPSEGLYPELSSGFKFVLPEGANVPDNYLGWLEDRRDGTIANAKKGRKYVGVNSWSIGDHELELLWRRYSCITYGVAIQSTYGDLKRSSKSDSVYIAKIQYIDQTNEMIPFQDEDGTVRFNMLAPFTYKDKQYRGDNELRSLIIRVAEEKGADPFDGIGGAYIRVCLDVLIEKICVSPRAPGWFKDVVRSVLERYNLSESLSVS